MILLIDDDAATNFLHRRAIRKADDNIEIQEAADGAEAMAFLHEVISQGAPPPQFIFLDINMPHLDGWGFLEEFRTLPQDWIAKTSLFVLTTSLNPDDHDRAKSYPQVTEVIDKMLSGDKLIDLLRNHRSASAA